MNAVKIIDKFCESGDVSLLKKLNENDLKYFVKMAKSGLKKKKSNREMCKLVIAAAEEIKSESKRGKVYISSFQRGKVQPSVPDTLRINVTSGSMNKIDGFPAKQASPMYLGPIRGAKIFENYWQYSKCFKELGHLTTDGTKTTSKWEQFRKKGFSRDKGDRHPIGTKTNEIIKTEIINGKRRNLYRYLRPVTSNYEGKMYDYISSRKAVYVPLYSELVEKTDFYKALKKKVDEGQSVLILDYDGPRDGIMEVTIENLVNKINDPKDPFGHGYVIAALLADITPEEYTQ